MVPDQCGTAGRAATRETKRAADLFRYKMTPKLLKEIRQLRALKVEHHDVGCNAGGKLRKSRKRKSRK